MLNRVRLAMLVTTLAILAGGALADATSRPVTVQAGKYSGTTSERIPITFTISGRKITHLATSVGYNGSCGQGGGPGFTITVAQMTISATGKFTEQITLVGPTTAVPNQKGTLTGKAAGSKVTGSIVDTTLAKPGHCNGYTATFAAARTR